MAGRRSVCGKRAIATQDIILRLLRKARDQPKVLLVAHSRCAGTREIRRLADQGQKLLFRDGDELDIGGRERRGAARLIVDQCRLAKNVVVGKLGPCAIAELDPDLTALDHEQLVGFVALAEDNAAGLDEFGFDVVAGQDGKAGSCLSFGPLILAPGHVLRCPGDVVGLRNPCGKKERQSTVDTNDSRRTAD